MTALSGGPCGVLLLDKPQGITSHDAVYKVRRLFGTRAVGHTGTLDPIATGVLVMMVGRATKAAQFLKADTKSYTARLTLGVRTDTLDTTGAVTSRSDSLPGEDEVRAAAAAFLGRTEQVPPMFSAIKKNGAKMADLARRGIEVELEPRPVEITRLDVSRVSEREYELGVDCSAGTYIRSLCRDIGDALGCGGAMSALRRTRAGTFAIENAYTLERLESMSGPERLAALLSVESLFADLPAVALPDFFERLARSGQPVYQHKISSSLPGGAPLPADTLVRLCTASGSFFAVARSSVLDNAPVLRVVKQF